MYDSQRKIRVLIADDSALMRRLLANLLNRDPNIDVVATARDGYEAINLTLRESPDVIVLDIEMPGINGLGVMNELNKIKPTPIIVFSAYTEQNTELTIKALSLGAVDVVPKPGGPISLNVDEAVDELINKIKLASRLGAKKLKKASTNINIATSDQHAEGHLKPLEANFPIAKVAVVIAASTGGPGALTTVLSELQIDPRVALLVVQHMPPLFTRHLAEHLDRVSNLRVKEATHKEKVKGGAVYVAPGDYHMVVDLDANDDVVIKLAKGPKINNVRPAADPLFISASKVFKSNTIAVVLTGLGSDGAEGVKAVKNAGGYVIAQDEETSVVFGMPRSAIETGCVDVVLPLHEISKEILRVTRSRVVATLRGV